MSVVLAQGEGENKRICAMATKALAITEKKCARLERLLLAAIWGVNRF